MTGWNPFAARPSDDQRSMDSLSPNDAETARVRDLLSRLATEPLPPTTATRLAARLDQELPAPAPRRRLLAHGYGRAALGAIVPLAIGVAIAFAVYSQDSGGVRDRGVFAPLSTAPALADEDAAGSSAAASSSSAAAATATGAPSLSVAAAPVATELSAGSATPTPDGTLRSASGAATAEPSVPAVTKRLPAAAVATLRASGFRVRFARTPAIVEADLGVNGYLVDQQEPAAGYKAPAGTVVTLQVVENYNAGGLMTSAPSPIGVPDVVGLEANAALHRLLAAGLLVTIRGSGSSLPSLTIVGQSPAAATLASSRSVVTLSLGR